MDIVPDRDALASLVIATAGDEDPMTRLRRAVEVNAELGRSGDELVERFVSDARTAGTSWTDIGQAFGTSKQAAQQRYGAGQLQSGTWPGPWAPPARHALEVASEHARSLGHNYVGTEHVLLGLLDTPDAMAAQVLTGLGVSREGILTQALPGPCGPFWHETLAIMPRLKRALELAIRTADGLGHSQANTEHLLAAIIQVPDALAIELLDCLGVTARDLLGAIAVRLGVQPARLAPARRRRHAGCAPAADGQLRR